METFDEQEPRPPNPDAGSSVPLSPRNLLVLFFRPSIFFARIERFSFTYLQIAALIVGLARAIGRMDYMMTRAEFREREAPIISVVSDHWVIFWVVVALVGLVWSVLLWYVAAWWYNLRLRMCGDGSKDRETVRWAYFYASLVQTLPAILILIAATALYPNYREYWYSDSTWPAIELIFPFWACVVAYKAAITIADLSRWKARFWFLILPITINVFAYGILAYLFAVLG